MLGEIVCRLNVNVQIASGLPTQGSIKLVDRTAGWGGDLPCNRPGSPNEEPVKC
jgi:hypothetical protein